MKPVAVAKGIVAGFVATLALSAVILMKHTMGLMPELDPMKRGGGDISFVAKELPSLTGLGSIGGGAHAAGEWVDLKSIGLQAKRDALFMLRLTRP